MDHQRVISGSSEGHQRVISGSSEGHQRVIRGSSAGHQRSSADHQRVIAHLIALADAGYKV